MIPAQTKPSAVGFSRLGELLPPMLVLTRGGARLTLTASGLETRLGVPGLAAKLTALIEPVQVHPEASRPVENFLGGKGGFKQHSLSLNANAVNKFQKALGPQEQGTILRSSEPVARARPVDNPGPDIERLAHHLALALSESDGLKNLTFYRKVARVVPRPVVLDALARTKDAKGIRKSRAHLFAFLVRPYLNR